LRYLYEDVVVENVKERIDRYSLRIVEINPCICLLETHCQIRNIVSVEVYYVSNFQNSQQNRNVRRGLYSAIEVSVICIISAQHNQPEHQNRYRHWQFLYGLGSNMGLPLRNFILHYSLGSRRQRNCRIDRNDQE
jgi:hypothetical protein